MAGMRLFRAAAVTIAAVGGLSSAAYGLLIEQSRRARETIGSPKGQPFNADGVYLPGVATPRVTAPTDDVLRFTVLGDSSAAGVGVDAATQLPGVLLAMGLAEESGRAVRLRTLAVTGATTKDMPGQVDAALRRPPQVVLILIGANDVTDKLLVRTSAELLAGQVARLRAAGVAVVVGTCPDLGAIVPIPQPLRAVARLWSLLLAKAQREAVSRAGGVPVALADLLSPEFIARPSDLFSGDRFHPNAAGYEAAAAILLAPLCTAAGVFAPRVSMPAVTPMPSRVSVTRPALRLLPGSGAVGIAT